MYEKAELAEYMAEIRERVCRRCIERPPDAPPCALQGKQCGIELHLSEIVDVCHAARGRAMDPYVERFHEDICLHCANRDSDSCPCPLDYLLQLAIEAIEAVDERRSQQQVSASLAGG